MVKRGSPCRRWGPCCARRSPRAGATGSCGRMGGARLRADDHRQPDVDRRSGGLYRPRLVIGADGVTLDLAGHTIAGDGHAANCPGDAPCYVGVDDSAGYPDVTFMGGGTIREFVIGVFAAAPAHRLRLERLTLRDNSRFGALVHGADDAVYARDVFADNGIVGLVAPTLAALR